MTSGLLAMFYLAIAVHVYHDAKRNGQWSWVRFFSILAATAIFLVAFIVPVARWQGGPSHPGAVVAIMLSGIVAFVAVLIIVLRKTAKKTTPVDVPPSHISPPGPIP